jgi:hypothetical protein
LLTSVGFLTDRPAQTCYLSVRRVDERRITALERARFDISGAFFN